MKSKFAKILGVVLTTLMVASILPFAIPVSAGEQSWSNWGSGNLPSPSNFVLAPSMIKAGPFDQDCNGEWIYAYAEFGPQVNANYPPEGPALIKSNDQGVTWELIKVNTPIFISGSGEYIIDIVCPKALGCEGDIFYLTNKGMYWSQNEGRDFVRHVSPSEDYDFTCFDVVLMKGVATQERYVAAIGVNSMTTMRLGGTGTTMPDGLYMWDQNVGSGDSLLPVNKTFNDAHTYDILAVKFAPTAYTDSALVAIGQRYNGEIRISSKTGSTWGDNSPDITISPLGPSRRVAGAAIAFPSDYNAKTAVNFIYSLDDPNGLRGGIFKIHNFKTNGTDFSKNERIDDPVVNVQSWSNLSMVGTTTNGTLIAGVSKSKLSGDPSNMVNICRNPFAYVGTGTVHPTAAKFDECVMSWNDPDTPVWVLLDKAFLTNGVAYALNGGVNGWGGFAKSTDYGVTWSQCCLINDRIDFIVDFAMIDVDSGKLDIFLISQYQETSAPTFNHFSYWRSLASNGNTWERVDVVDVDAASLDPTLFAYDRIALSPDYLDDSTVFRYEWMGIGTGVLERSIDKFASFEVVEDNTLQIWSFQPLSAEKWVIGSDGMLSTQANDSPGLWWDYAVDYIIVDLALGSNGHVVALGQDANGFRLFRTTNSGQGASGWSFASAAHAAITKSGSYGTLTLADNYASTNNAFIGLRDLNSSSDDAIYRCALNNGTRTWTKISSTGSTTSLVSAAAVGNTTEGSGVVYGVGSRTARILGTQNDCTRINGGTDPFSGSSVDYHTRIIATSKQSGNVILFASRGATIYTYTDYLAVTGTGVSTSEPTKNSATGKYESILTFDKLAYASGTNPYQVKVGLTDNSNLKNYFNTTLTPTGVTVTSIADIDGQKAYRISGLDLSTTYYVYVWAQSPVPSFMFTEAGATIVTPPDRVVKIIGLVPAPGATNIPIRPSFEWLPNDESKVYGYQFELFTAEVGDSVAYNSNIPSRVLSYQIDDVTIHNLVWGTSRTALLYNTNYVWRVRSIGADAKGESTGVYSEWSTFTFTTVATPPTTVNNTTTVTAPAPAIPVPVISLTIPAGPTVTVNEGVQNPTFTIVPPDTATPPYVWIVIGIGAVLCVAVIILIVRTRRVA
ncbi:MAG: hypothetical protein FWH42_00265 [Dehalococcoidia bacterium]|nr:hypothetical protein [Dehalococcoidia bacterium]